MKKLQQLGLGIFLIGLALFCSLMFLGSYNLSNNQFQKIIESKRIKSEIFTGKIKSKIVDKEFSSSFEISEIIINSLKESNKIHKTNREWNKVIYDKPHSFSYEILKVAGTGIIKENKVLFWLLTFGLGIFGEGFHNH